MNKIRRTLIAAIAVAVAPVPLALRAQQGGDTGYTTLQNALPVANPGKIEVAEFFWYGCIHCYNLEPALDVWLPKLPADAYFRRIPAVFNERWAHDAAIYYAFEALGLLDKLHRPFFEAIHKDRLKTDNPAALNEWLSKNGVDLKKFEAAMKSFGVQSKVKRAVQLTTSAQIDGTPALMVQGRYTISTEQGRSREGMLANAERLIAALRKNLAPVK
ncbi:MAG: thiol:disulfide interchange protein DsbA/DsbL [Betaproteobacteria bacterium]|nr:thiol:disulfide interchange protein DsbA/DsbL [Betaproteobacteria bacterium]